MPWASIYPRRRHGDRVGRSGPTVELIAEAPSTFRAEDRLRVVAWKGRLKAIEEGNLRCLQSSARLVEIEPFDAVDLGECLDGA
jgi:hypothetical protein